MNITKLNQRIDDIEDEIYREKLKIKKCADELGDTFDDMLSNYWFGGAAFSQLPNRRRPKEKDTIRKKNTI